MPEVTDIIAANGDVWRVAPLLTRGNCVELQVQKKVGTGLVSLWIAVHIPADVLPRVVEALSNKLFELSELSQHKP